MLRSPSWIDQRGCSHAGWRASEPEGVVEVKGNCPGFEKP